jgi:sulfite reductase beta subunit-like hemoprotein
VPELLDHIAAAGLTTRGRAATRSQHHDQPYAGVHVDEVFDVTPCDEALTILPRPSAEQQLPRSW